MPLSLSLTTACRLPGAVVLEVKNTSAPVKSTTGALKTAVKWIGWVFVESFCPAAWLIVTVGDVS